MMGRTRQVLDRDRTYEGAWLNLGNTVFRKRAYGRALERYRKELSAYPSPKVWVAIGSTYEKQRQPDSARYAYDQAIALDSTYASAYLHLGQLHKSRGALDQAVAASRIGLRLDPDNVNYQYAGSSMRHQGALTLHARRGKRRSDMRRSTSGRVPFFSNSSSRISRAAVQVTWPRKDGSDALKLSGNESTFLSRVSCRYAHSSSTG